MLIFLVIIEALTHSFEKTTEILIYLNFVFYE